ncbi:helix-turn-helix domain-containing protein [Anoxynatronum buryatiense]|uniref:AraC-type DNA-binding protein n=1 Tax=Anoxynatronum buryatiense TaxID=489973 RepID=A0AA46AIN3_9CLOT|nr:AraC family transcriptional regulator [Anoxynatronum buryatiense]SMP51209.1 AraC-type DNA-binding protein [Anoxynatronum buryatiense]
MEHNRIDMNYRTLTAQNQGLSDHFHIGYEMILVTEGESVFTINDQIRHFNTHSLIFINNLEKHRMQTYKTPYSRYIVIIEADYFDSVMKDPALLSIFKIRPKDFKNGFQLRTEDVQPIQQLFETLSAIHQKKEEFWQIEFTGLLSQLMVLLYRGYRQYFPIQNIDKAERRIFEIQAFIDEHFKKPISLEFLAEEFYVNKYYLAHSFKEVTGFTIKQYILLKKIAFAKNELYFTEKSMTEVAMDSGFNSQSHFIRMFQQKENKTPLQFRKHYRKKSGVPVDR